MFRRRIALLLSAGTLAVGLGIATAGTANAVVPPDPNWNEIISPFDHSADNTMCIDDPGHSATFNTRLELWHCHGSSDSNGAPQRWLLYPTFLEDGTPAYTIYLYNTLSVGGDNPGHFLCMGYYNNDAWDNQPMALSSCQPGFNEWIMDTDPGVNNIMLRDPNTDLCMAAANSSDSNGTPLVARFCDPDDTSQVWTLG